MRRRTIFLTAASLVYCSPSVFSVNDDLLAFPQYEVIFSDKYISDVDAESKLSDVSSSSSARAVATSIPKTQDEKPAELSSWKNDGSSSAPTYLDSDSLDLPETYEYMVLDASPYLCSVPQVPDEPRNKTSAAYSKVEEEKELARATDRGWELLKDMEGNCMYFMSGWWSYSFCYNKEVKQFHQLPPGRAGVPTFPPVEDDQTPWYILGRYRGQEKGAGQTGGQQSIGDSADAPSEGSDVAQIQTKGEMRYMVQKLSGGTPCDLTGRDRKIEVQFHCHPQSMDRIGWIKEVTTCSYLIVIYTPRLCNDVAFQPPRETKAHPIICREIVAESEVDEWKAKKAAEAEKDIVNARENEDLTRPIVGGIEVGGMKIVGREGQRIDPPKIADPSEGRSDIVAKADPNEKGGKVQRLSNEDLKKMDLDPATVEKLRKELQELAGDKAWSLEVVDTPGGFRELRGIVAGDDEGEGEGEIESGVPDDEGEREDGSEEIYKDEL